MKLSDEILMAYVDGELDPPTEREVAAAAAQDPEASGKIAQHLSLRKKLRAAYDPILMQAVPERLVAALVAPTEIARARATRWSMPVWAAMAASVVIALMVGFLLHGATGPTPALIAFESGGTIARGPLARALSTQLSGESTSTSIQIGLSFRAKSGEYCRTFNLSPARGGAAGLACRQNDAWNVKMLAQPPAAAGGEYRLATSDGPVMTAVNAMNGEVLDAKGEKTALEQGWR